LEKSGSDAVHMHVVKSVIWSWGLKCRLQN